MREIVFDTETTGLSHASGDRMVEIGCIELFNRNETGRSFHAYFHPDRDMPIEAERVHGLSIGFLSDKPRFHEGVEALLEFLGDAPLVAHNAAFDFGFLNAELTAVRPRDRRDGADDRHAGDGAQRVIPAPSTASMRCARATASIAATASSMARCSTRSCSRSSMSSCAAAGRSGWGWRTPRPPRSPSPPRRPARRP